MWNIKYVALTIQRLTVSLVLLNTHVKYQSSSFHCSKVISKVKVSKMGQTPRSMVKNNGTTALCEISKL